MIELDDNDIDPGYSLGSLSLTLDQDYPPDVWEHVEDAVADALGQFGIKGSITNSVTGNSTTIKNKFKGKTMSVIRLECTNGGHNKFYEFHGVESNGRFTVRGLYGRIGQAASEAVIYDGDNKDEANRAFTQKKNEKLKKGYVVISQNGKAAPPPASEKKTLLIFL
jgi:predicted DNA-binding WGR domain protein